MGRRPSAIWAAALARPKVKVVKDKLPQDLTRVQRRALHDAAWLWREGGARDLPGAKKSDEDPDLPRLDLPRTGTLLTGWVHPVAYEVLYAADPPKRRSKWGPAPKVFGRRDHNAPGTCGVMITKGVYAGKRCPQTAGQGTSHLGAGPCIIHGGALGYGKALGAWLMAHAFGQELDITPWDALLKAVRIAAGKVAYCEWVISTASNDLELEGRVVRGENGILVHPDTGEPLGVGAFRDLSYWVHQSQLWHERMARTAKMAVDAGVAKWIVEKTQHDAEAIARVLNSVVEDLDGTLDESTLLRVRNIMRKSLLALDGEATKQLTAGSADVGAVDSTYVEG